MDSSGRAGSSYEWIVFGQIGWLAGGKSVIDHRRELGECIVLPRQVLIGVTEGWGTRCNNVLPTVSQIKFQPIQKENRTADGKVVPVRMLRLVDPILAV